jgi:hypothetical protein
MVDFLNDINHPSLTDFIENRENRQCLLISFSVDIEHPASFVVKVAGHNDIILPLSKYFSFLERCQDFDLASQITRKLSLDDISLSLASKYSWT